MAPPGGGCMRMLGFVMTIAIVLSIFAVSFESEFWQFWGAENSPRTISPSVEREATRNSGKVRGFADASPIKKNLNDVSEKADMDSQDGLDDSESFADVIEAEDLMERSQTGNERNAIGKNGAPLDKSRTEAVGKSDMAAILPNFETGIGQPELSTEKPSPNPETSAPAKTAETTTDTSQDDGLDESNTAEQYAFQSIRRSRARTFLVVFMGHSGSTAFTTELRTHTEFEVELLEPLEHGDYAKNTDLALERAGELMERGIAKGKIPGFKIRPFHIQNKPQEWRDFVNKYDTRVIWQYRENLMKQAIGEYRHRFLNDDSVVEGLSRNEKPCAKGSNQKCRIKIENMRGLHGLLNDFTASDELLSAAARSLQRNDDMSIVKYEDYLYRRERTMRETFDFFGVDFQDTAPQRLKASPDSLCQMVSNFQELCDLFLPCQLWRPFLHDDVNNCRCKPGGSESFDSTYCKRTAWYQGN